MDKLKLIFKNSNGKERVIAEPKDIDECFKEINKFLEDHNFQSYYTRMWMEAGRLKFDVGSYTEFFYVEGVTLEEVDRNNAEK